MSEILLIATGVVLVTGMSTAYRRSRDILHPALFLGPLFLYGAVLDPWLVRNDLNRFFRQPEQIDRVLILYFLAVAALVLGLLHQNRSRRGLENGHPGRTSLADRDRAQLHGIALTLAIVGLACYVYGIVNVGGFVTAYSRFKGGGYAASGYVAEATNLGLVSAMMIALSQFRRGLTGESLLVLVIGLLPNLLQGTFGGRRGPLFVVVAAASLAWLLVMRRRPRFWMLAGCLAIASLGVVFVWSQRRHLYFGSQDAGIHWDSFYRTLTQDDPAQGDNFIYGAGYVLATERAGGFTLGRKLAVNLLVRPVPKQLWPTKYEDVGATWITSDYPGLGNLTLHDWIAAVGWLPPAGSAAISIADLFGEFSWGAIVAFYLIGRGFNSLYGRRSRLGGVWTLLYLEALIPSIYLATQSFDAFYYRYLILSVPTVVVWTMVRGSHRPPSRVFSPTRAPVQSVHGS